MASKELKTSDYGSTYSNQGSSYGGNYGRTPARSSGGQRNVSPSGRWLSTLAGGVFLYRGLTGRNPVVSTLLGGYLAYRGATGHCPVSASLSGTSAAPREEWGVSQNQGIHVDHTVLVHKSPEVLYNFWRNFENLPRFMDHLESVTTLGGGRSRWVAKAPLGTKVEWEAETVGDQPNELISWRSLPGSDVPNAGSVRFKPVQGGQATEVKVSLKYNPPAGAIGAAVAKLFGEEPSQQIGDDLENFKRLMESGGATTGAVTGSTTGGGAWASEARAGTTGGATGGTTTSALSADKTGLSAGRNQGDKVTEASEESFPASDPPAFSGRRTSSENSDS